jgi:DNA-binding LacI/PurR family transcriptional regulator
MITSDCEMSATLKDIARECGVDVATVSRSLSGAYGVNQATRANVLAVAARLKYRPNRLAMSLVTGKSRTLAMIISDIRNPFFAELTRGAEDAAYEAGYELILCNSDLNPAKESRYVHSLLEKRVEGILMNSVSGLNEEEQEELSRSGVPIVLLNRPSASARIKGFSTVLADNYTGGYMAGRHLIDLGHRVIGHVTGAVQHGNLRERAKGFNKSLQETDSKVTPMIIHGRHSDEGGYRMMKKLLKRPGLTAVFAANDAMAFGAIRAIFESGLRVPDDISVIGFDNVDMASLVRPPLTTVHQPKYEMGRAAVEVLLRKAKQGEMATPEHRLLEVRLVKRESCRSVTNKEYPRHGEVKPPRTVTKSGSGSSKPEDGRQTIFATDGASASSRR